MRSHLFSRRLWTKDFVLILLVCTIASYPNSILISLLPVYVLDLGGTNTWTGMMMTGLTLLGMVTNAAVAPSSTGWGGRSCWCWAMACTP